VRNDVILDDDPRLCGDSREDVEAPSLAEKNDIPQQFPANDTSLSNSIRSAIDTCIPIYSDIHMIEGDQFLPQNGQKTPLDHASQSRSKGFRSLLPNAKSLAHSPPLALGSTIQL
jgi:hypothetical protein